MKHSFSPALLALLALVPGYSIHADDAAVRQIFDKQCAECHDENEPPVLNGGINLFSLRSTEDMAEKILDRVTRADQASGRMPKSGATGSPGYRPPLTEPEIAALRDWVKGTPAAPPQAPAAPAPNAPAGEKPQAKPQARAFIPLADEVRAIAADLRALDAARQPFVRYLTLTNLANLRDAAGQPVESEDQLAIYRAAQSKLINSVSLGGRVVPPVSVDAGRTIHRIDLRDYGWTAQDWEQVIVQGYPYALRGINGRAEDEIAALSGSQSAWVRADWFVFAVSQPPFYHTLLRLPSTEPELEKQYQVDTLANLRAQRAFRAGFRKSGVSQSNRLIERHEALHGMYWKSYDFNPLVRNGGHDLFRSPLGPVGAGLTKNADREFRHDGGEIIFRLRNGLHAYYLATADGKRLDRAPTEIVQDKKRADGAIINGISCLACHDRGMKYARDESLDQFLDEIGPVALDAGLDRDEAQVVRTLYASKEALHAAVKRDEDGYTAALAEAMPGYTQATEPVAQLYNRFKKEITLETVAAEFGEQDSTFIDRLKNSRDADLESLAVILEKGGGFPRSSWLDQFGKIAQALGYRLREFTPVAYTEFTSGAAVAAGNVGKVPLAEGGTLRIETDQAHYKKGDLLTVSVKSTEGVFLRLYHLSAEGVLQQIFPNGARKDNFIRGGKDVVVLGSKKKKEELAPDEFSFLMHDPYGTEIILAVASPVQFSDTENLTFAEREVFKSFAGEHDLREALRRGTKGLTVQTADAEGKPTGFKSAPVFTARAVFTVGP